MALNKETKPNQTKPNQLTALPIYIHKYIHKLIVIMRLAIFIDKDCSILMIWLIGSVGRVFANDPGDRGSIPGRVIPKTLKMTLDTS